MAMCKSFAWALCVGCAVVSSGAVAQDRAKLAKGLDVPASKTIYKESYRLLINYIVQPDGSLQVGVIGPASPALQLTEVRDPATRGSLEPGDRITHINGVKITSLEAYNATMDRANGKCTITVIDKNSGRPIDWNVTAAKVQVVDQQKPPPSSGDRKARVLLMGLSDDASIGPMIGQSLTTLETLMKNEIAADKLDLKVVKGAAITAEGLIAEVKSLGERSKPQDALFVYYLGHGAYDPMHAEGDPAGGHFFQIPGGDLLRKTMFENLLTQPGQLKVLFTDTCNVQSVASLSNRVATEAMNVKVTGATNLEQLLLNHRGYLDVSASSKDQFSWFSMPVGGWFSFKFSEEAPQYADWSTFLDKLSLASNGFYQENRAQILQNPAGTPQETIDYITNQTDMKPAVFRMSLLREQPATGGPQRTINRVVPRLVR